MTRIAIIRKHTGADVIVSHADNATDLEMLEYAKTHFGPLHNIQKVEVCELSASYDNVAPIDNWINTTKRLKS